ncbi:hypothetical protein AU198_18555 [Mycobacterium sp. GA-1199]|nr:hypothetical protein AU198_18555 [Mycobacterium sp. GA-1199]
MMSLAARLSTGAEPHADVPPRSQRSECCREAADEITRVPVIERTPSIKEDSPQSSHTHGVDAVRRM